MENSHLLEDEEVLEGVFNGMRLAYGFVDSMAIKCAIELKIADIIHSQGEPISLLKIASLIDGSSTSVDISYLARIMRFLVLKKVFTVQHPLNGEEPLYDLSSTSRWLLHDSDLSIAPMILLQNHSVLLAPLHYFSRCVKQGGNAFKMVHGVDCWELGSKNLEFNKLFNDGMRSISIPISVAILEGYNDGFGSITGTLVDVGGGTGSLIAEVVNIHSHIKGINFDLPQVIDTAPQHEGVTYIGGDMFVAIPKADAIFMKSILHDWNDEECLKILKNCRKAIPENTGKLILAEIVIFSEFNDPLNEMKFNQDLTMMAHTSGKERTELEWKDILIKAGFPRYKIIKINQGIHDIIEAFTA
jgi:hypothetical protein